MKFLKIAIALPIILFFLSFSSCQETLSKKEHLEKTIKAQVDSIDGTVAVAYYSLSQSKDSLLINVDEEFHAASTMKVPVMIELFKQAAEGKLDLNDSILLKNEFKSIVDGSLYSMDIADDSDDVIYDQIGIKVEIKDLIHSMITVSSNLATNILIELVGAEQTTTTMRELGAKNIEVLRGVEDQKAYDKGLSNSTTARDLMVIMEAIANHTAGTSEDCEAMLAILKDQQHRDVIPKFLPKNVEVAHKTGSITGVHHDAGIVYLPDGRAYILVLLSKNLKDFDQSTDQLAKLSKTFYDYVLSN